VSDPTLAIAAGLAAVRARIDAAAARAGRDPSSVTLVGVSKTVGVERVRAALRAGLVDLGENRAQELVAKAAELAGAAPAPRWHFVGRLQRNKVRMLAPHVGLWHSIDRPRLVEVLAREAPGARVLVQVDLGGEPQKGGCPPADVAPLVERLGAAGLRVEGLMTVPRQGDDPRPAFAALRSLGADLGLSALSMGMSDDFEVAVEEGATLVRVGRALFGPRPEPAPARR